MIELLLHLLLTSALLMIVAKLVSGIEIRSWGSAFLAAIVLGLVNALVRPLMVVLTIPFTVITFGLFLFVINALMLMLVGAIVPGVKIQGFLPALLGSLLLTALNVLIGMMFGPPAAVKIWRRPLRAGHRPGMDWRLPFCG